MNEFIRIKKLIDRLKNNDNSAYFEILKMLNINLKKECKFRGEIDNDLLQTLHCRLYEILKSVDIYII